MDDQNTPEVTPAMAFHHTLLGAIRSVVEDGRKRRQLKPFEQRGRESPPPLFSFALQKQWANRFLSETIGPTRPRASTPSTSAEPRPHSKPRHPERPRRFSPASASGRHPPRLRATVPPRSTPGRCNREPRAALRRP